MSWTSSVLWRQYVYCFIQRTQELCVERPRDPKIFQLAALVFTILIMFLQELGPQIHNLAHASDCHICTLDEFIQGLLELHRTARLPMWLVVACQIYLDIYDLLGQNTKQGADALQDALQRNREIHKAAVHFEAREYGGLACSDIFKDALDWLAKPLLPFEGDECLTADSRVTHVPTEQKLKTQKASMERLLPAQAGAVLMELELRMHNMATSLANSGCVVLGMAHVYKELRATGRLEPQWHDMEFALTAFGAPPLFPAAKSQHPKSSVLRRLHINLGSQPGGLPRQLHRKESALNSALQRMRMLHVVSPLLQNMCDKSKWDKMGHAHSKSKMVEIALHSLTPSEKKTENANRKAPGNQLRATKCTPSQLLATFKKTIISQEPILNFDCIGFMISCATILYELYNESWFQIFLLKSSFANSHPMVAVSHALLENLEAPEISKAAERLAAHIKEHSKDFLKPSYARSSGRIPKDARPAICGVAGDGDNLGTRGAARRVVSKIPQMPRTHSLATPWRPTIPRSGCRSAPKAASPPHPAPRSAVFRPTLPPASMVPASYALARLCLHASSRQH